jgi:hypothetical protein
MCSFGIYIGLDHTIRILPAESTLCTDGTGGIRSSVESSYKHP